ncbi:ABC transporter ATP-binding protein [uncultured Alsobacter sp.]|uniref:ABC transporter ATP-binding protein n=1 Tax=uncultured Alsobacter sp. TaxID=1748258 RepID=UPI0025EC363B|nr:ATP-binding cassette domain-containing protein [uncultured Alsobacter sp.]
MLELDIRRKEYRGVSSPLLAVRDLKLCLEAGRFGAVLGESGCGKSTALRILAGLDPDYEGEVRRPGEGRLGIVFQEPRLLPWRTVEQNVRLALPQPLEGRDLAPLFASLGLAEHRDRHPGELSLGLARRAALARAFAVEPDLLLLDEPFVSLDPATAGRLRGELADLVARSRATTLMVTHDEEEALALADTVFVLSPRPARLLGEVTLDRPRGARDAGWVAERRREIERLRAG